MALRPIWSISHEVVRDRHLKRVTHELDAAVPVVNVAGPLKDLHGGLLLADLQDLALAHAVVGEGHVRDLAIGREPDVIHDHQRAPGFSERFGLQAKQRLDHGALDKAAISHALVEDAPHVNDAADRPIEQAVEVENFP